MKRDLAALTGRTHDFLIVGGGIVGAGIAWDASLRGFSCALVDQGDFAGGTSSKTTKLIHGGIRYLESLDFGLVRESLRERRTLLRIAPQFVRPARFLIPVSGGYPRPWPMVRLGVALYEWLARTPGNFKVFTGERLEKEEPFLAGGPFRRAAGYSDAQMDDTGMVLGVIRAAAEAGTRAANYTAVTGWILERGRVSGAALEDRLTGARHEVRARMVINAAGPWVDRLRRLGDPSLRSLVRPSKGIHLVYPDLGLKHSLVVSSRKDGRIFFLIPWRGMTLIGTTDTDYAEDPAAARAGEQDVEYLLSQANAALPGKQFTREKIIATFAGVRPLVLQEKKDPWAVSRAHLIHQDPNGLLSVVGGKFTMFRRIAEQVVDRAERAFKQRLPRSCATARTPLGPEREKEEKISRWAREDPSLARPVCPHHAATWGQARHAVEEEMAVTLSDLLFRRLRSGLSPCGGLDSLEEAAERVGDWLGWDAAERRRQAEHYRREVELGKVVG